VKQASEQTTLRKMKPFSYTRYAINNPLSGLLYSREALKSTGLNEEQMRHPNVADHCHHQLDKILAVCYRHSVKVLPSVTLGKQHTASTVSANSYLPNVFYRALGKWF